MENDMDRKGNFFHTQTHNPKPATRNKKKH